MRLDQFLKATRLVKQRTASKWACESGRVEILGRKAKPGTVVRPGDEITIHLRDRSVRIRVLEIPTGNVSKARARTLYEIVEEWSARGF
jgi:ribosomal 50S subunit-recycling heat shock protein